MRISITQNKTRGTRLMVLIFWLAVWQLASVIISQELLLVSPVAVLKVLGSLIFESSFWRAIGNSFTRIVAGFFLGTALAILLAVISGLSYVVRTLLSPLFGVIKSVPVASFIILVLIWSGSRNLAAVISFLIVLPVIYTNVLQGILVTDTKLLEMAQVFRVSRRKRLRAIYIPAIMPYFSSACKVALGLSWKSGIAAEVIGLPGNTIGEQLYNAKIFLNTAELFGWTLVIVAVSFLFEKLFFLVLRQGEKCLIGGGVI